MIRLLLRCVWVVAGVGVCSVASGLTLGPGDTVPASGAAITWPDLAGTELARQDSPFVLYTSTELPAMTGVLTSRVVRTAGGTLDFYYQMTNTQQVFAGLSGTFPVALFERFATGSFAAVSTDAFYVSPAAGATPGTFSRSGDGELLSVVFIHPPETFPFDYPLLPGVNTAEIVVRTDAVSYTLGGALLTGDLFDARYLGNGRSTTSGSVTAFAPGAIPEPGTAVLLLVSAGVPLWRVRRRTYA